MDASVGHLVKSGIILVHIETLNFFNGFAEIFCMKPTDLGLPLPLLVVPPASHRETEKDMITILILPVSSSSSKSFCLIRLTIGFKPLYVV